MAAGHGGGGGLRAASNHPALAVASAAPPYLRRGVFSAHLLLMSLRITPVPAAPGKRWRVIRAARTSLRWIRGLPLLQELRTVEFYYSTTLTESFRPPLDA